MNTTATAMDGRVNISQRQRLLIQGLIVVEMILLTASAFRWGLCATNTSTNTIPTASAFVHADYDNDNSKWCPSFLVQKDQVTKLLLKQTIEAFHDDDAGTNTTTSRTRLQRYRLKLVLQLEDGPVSSPSQQQHEQHQRQQTLYQQWSGAWNEWMEQTSFSKWPFWKESPTSTVILGGTLTKLSTTKQQQTQEHVETRLVSTSLVEELFQSYLNRLNDDELEIILYVYAQPLERQSESRRLFFADESTGKESEALVIHQNRLIILQGSNASTLGDSMSYLIPFLSTITTTLAYDDHDDAGTIMNDSTTIEAWQQRVAKSYIQHLQSELRSTRDWLVQLSTTTNINIPARIGEQWMHALMFHNQAIQQYHQQHAVAAEQKQPWRDVLELLEQAHLQLAQLRADPSLMPPLHFQMDHTLAVFAPLLFPLLMPMMVGLRREYKRYKTGSFV